MPRPPLGHSFPSPPPSPGKELPSPGLCYINRSFEMDQEEAVLGYLAAFVQIAGTRPAIQPQDALRAIAAEFQLNEATLEVFRAAPPADFLVRFPDHTSLQRALRGDRGAHPQFYPPHQTLEPARKR